MALRVAVIGAGPAGMTAASRVKRLVPDASVTVFEQTRWVSFALCGIPYYIGGLFSDPSLFMHYPPHVFTEKRGIDLRLKHVVEEIDPGRRIVKYSGPSGEGYLEYDYLVLATGAKGVIPPVPGTDLRGVYTLRHIDDALIVRRVIEEKKPRKIVIVGLGYTGLELADNLKHRGFDVFLFGLEDYPLQRVLDSDMGSILLGRLLEMGFNIGTREALIEIKSWNDRLRVETDKRSIDADMVILATGIKPNTDLVVQAGLKIGETGAIWVDEYLRTSDPNIFSAGDNTETWNIVSGKRVWSPFAQVANKMGYVAGSNIAGRNIKFPGVAGTSVLGVKDLIVSSTGIREQDARKHGFTPISARIEASTKPKYMPNGGKVVLKIVADKNSGRIIGAQAIGGIDDYWRVNVVAGLLQLKAKIQDLFFTDIGYSPLVNSVWDALIIAARILMRYYP